MGISASLVPVGGPSNGATGYTVAARQIVTVSKTMVQGNSRLSATGQVQKWQPPTYGHSCSRPDRESCQEAAEQSADLVAKTYWAVASNCRSCIWNCETVVTPVPRPTPTAACPQHLFLDQGHDSTGQRGHPRLYTSYPAHRRGNTGRTAAESTARHRVGEVLGLYLLDL